MANNKDVQRLAMSDIFKNLLFCSNEPRILEKQIDVNDPKELHNGWQAVIPNAKYVACETNERRIAEQTDPSVKSDSSKKRKKKDKEKESQESIDKYDKYNSLGVLSYGVPSWRTIIEPETCTYIQRPHPCLYNAVTGHIVHDLQGLSFIDPAGILDQHLSSFVQQKWARNVLQPSFGINNYTAVQSDSLKMNSDVEINRVKHCPLGLHQVPLNGSKPLVEPKAETSSMPKPQTLKPLPMTSSKGNLQTSSITITRKTLPPVLKHKTLAIDRKTDHLHREILHSQKIKLLPFKQPFTPVNFQVVRPNRKQNQKLNWLPISMTSPCLPRSTPVGQSAVRKPTWSKPMLLSHDSINEAVNHLKEQMEVKQ